MGNSITACLPSALPEGSAPPAVKVAQKMRLDAKGVGWEDAAGGSGARLLGEQGDRSCLDGGEEVCVCGFATDESGGGKLVAPAFVVTSSEDTRDGTTGLTMVEGSDDWYTERAVLCNEVHTVTIGLMHPATITRVRLCSFSGGSWQNRLEVSAGNGRWAEAAGWSTYGSGDRGPFWKAAVIASTPAGAPLASLGEVTQMRVSARFTDPSRGKSIVGCNRGFTAWGLTRQAGTSSTAQ